MARRKTTILNVSIFDFIILCLIILLIVMVLNKAGLIGRQMIGSWATPRAINPYIKLVTNGIEGVTNGTEGPSEGLPDSKGERKCRKFLKEILGPIYGVEHEFEKTRPYFLKNNVTSSDRKEHFLEIDCYSPTLKLGVEYNGVQHYRYTPFFHRNWEAFRNQQYRDDLKARLCREHGVQLIIVPYKVKNIFSFLNEQLGIYGYL